VGEDEGVDAVDYAVGSEDVDGYDSAVEVDAQAMEEVDSHT